MPPETPPLVFVLLYLGGEYDETFLVVPIPVAGRIFCVCRRGFAVHDRRAEKYDPAKHYRFHDCGGGTACSQFIGAGWDWSGVGRAHDHRFWVTMLTPTIGITANHQRPDPGKEVWFHTGHGPNATQVGPFHVNYPNWWGGKFPARSLRPGSRDRCSRFRLGSGPTRCASDSAGDSHVSGAGTHRQRRRESRP